MRDLKRNIGLLWMVLLIGLLALSACGSSTAQTPQSKDQVPRISAEVLKNRLDSGEDILIVDSRSVAEFQNRHIVGAISVPYNEVESRLAELPKDQEIVFYCT
jgi:hypothetical protein